MIISHLWATKTFLLKALFLEFVVRPQKFEMDETNVNAMIQAIDEERLTEPQYYNQIMDMAALTVSRLENTPLDEDFLDMMFSIGINMYNRRKFEITIQICQNIIDKLEKSGKSAGKNIVPKSRILH